jgi:hypothetical protein
MGLRGDFEVSVLFHADLLPPVKGPLKRGTNDGKYINGHVEYMFNGYKLGRARSENQLKRYEPDRPLPDGLMNQLREATGDAFLEPEAVRAILKIVGGTPV